MSALTDEEIAAWERAATQAGDAAGMLIAGIARGNLAHGLARMTPEEIEEEWPPVTDSSSGEEIAAMVRDPDKARACVESWGSPWR